MKKKAASSHREHELTLRFMAEPTDMNIYRRVHGGAVMTFLDVIMATAARSVQPGMGVVTIEMKTSFVRPAPADEAHALVAHGKLLHRTRSLAFVEGSVLDAQGQLCAHATGTFKYVPSRAAQQGGAGRISTD